MSWARNERKSTSFFFSFFLLKWWATKCAHRFVVVVVVDCAVSFLGSPGFSFFFWRRSEGSAFRLLVEIHEFMEFLSFNR